MDIGQAFSLLGLAHLSSTNPKLLAALRCLEHKTTRGLADVVIPRSGRPSGSTQPTAADFTVEAANPALRTTRIVPRTVKLHLADIDAMVAAFDEGATLRGLAARFGVSRKAVTKHLRLAGRNTGRRFITEAKANRIRDLRASGQSCAAIARMVGVSASSVWEVERREQTVS